MTLERLSDLLVLLPLFYLGMQPLVLIGEQPSVQRWARSGVIMFLLWTLAALHALVHLGGRE